jgi:hypothetical protein
MFEPEMKRLEEIRLAMIELQRQSDGAQGNSQADYETRVRLVREYTELDNERHKIQVKMAGDRSKEKVMKVMNSQKDEWGDVCQCHRGTGKVYKEPK